MTAYFTSSPFALTADLHSARTWAGRPDVLSKLHRIRAGYSARSDSSLALVWANLGAGKTHALLHLAHLVESINAVPAYVEMPHHPKRFLDLYQRVVERFSSTDLVDAGRAERLTPDLKRALHILHHGGTDEQDLVRDWLAGGKPALRELKSVCGINSRIEDDTRASDILCALVAAFRLRGRRVVLLIDEFQRIGGVTNRQREAVLSHLRSIFSRNSSHFSVVLAVASRMERTALELIPQELRTLMGVLPMIDLPAMDRHEARMFVLERLKAFRPAGYSGDPASPFGQDIIDAAIEFIFNQDCARLIPRTVLQALAYLYDQILVGSTSLAVADVKTLLAELRWEE